MQGCSLPWDLPSIRSKVWKRCNNSNDYSMKATYSQAKVDNFPDKSSDENKQCPGFKIIYLYYENFQSKVMLISCRKVS